MKLYLPFILAPCAAAAIWLWLRHTGRFERTRAWTLTAGFGFFVLTEVGRSFYRPYAYAHHPDKPMIANTIGNSLGTLAAIFVFLSVSGDGTRKDLGRIILVIAGLVAYELSNALSGYPVDPADIIATLVCGSFAFPLYWLIHHRKAGSD